MYQSTLKYATALLTARVNLAATHIRALEYVDLDTLQQFAL